MRITNRLGLPEVLVRALQRDPYSRGASRYSATMLIDAPQPRILKAANADNVERDISDSVWMLLGKGVHHVLEHGAAAEGDPDHTIEERIFIDIQGVRLSGAMDVQRHPGGSAEIIDWKVTSTFRVTSPDGMKKWEEQLNLYRIFRVIAKDHIASGGVPEEPMRRMPFDQAEQTYPGDVQHLTIVAFLRDWSKSRARQSQDYPQQPVMRIPLRLWSLDEAHGYLNDRVKAHKGADDFYEMFGVTPECTDEERWKRAGTWEVVQMTKDGREWVRQTFSGDDAKEKAEAQRQENIAAFKAWKPETFIREREAVPTRCMDWCEAADFCPQWKKEKPQT